MGKEWPFFLLGGWGINLLSIAKETPTHNRNFEKLQSLVWRFTLENQNFTNLTGSQAHRDIITFFSPSIGNFFRLSGCYGKAVESWYIHKWDHIWCLLICFSFPTEPSLSWWSWCQEFYLSKNLEQPILNLILTWSSIKSLYIHSKAKCLKFLLYTCTPGIVWLKASRKM